MLRLSFNIPKMVLDVVDSWGLELHGSRLEESNATYSALELMYSSGYTVYGFRGLMYASFSCVCRLRCN